MTDVLGMTLTELRDEIASGSISSQQATKVYLDVVEEREPQVSAFREVLADRALTRAAEVDDERQAGKDAGPLAGVPIAVKDNLCTPFGRTTCSSKILANFKAPYMSTAVGKLVDAGAVILGKTNMDEFAMGSSTENSGFGATRNPWDLNRVPGGSSGGSATAVASRMCAAALGSDTGGSIRQPAAFCGVAGLKPTYGRVSRYGLVAYGSSLDQIGPITHDVADCALLTQVISGHDPRDSTSLTADVPDLPAAINAPPGSLRIGLPKEFYSDALDVEINAAIHKAADTLAQTGAQLVEISLPHSRIDRDAEGKLSSYAVACYYIVAMAEASSNLARYDGVHYGHRTSKDVEGIVEMYSKSRAEGFGQEVKRRIMLGNYTLSAGYYEAYYSKALKVRRLIKNDFDEAFKLCDVVLCPTTPTTAFQIGEKASDPLTMYLADIYTISVNLAGLPGLSLPCGLSAEGMPIGMQLIGPPLGEPVVLQVGRLFEQVSGISRLTPPIVERTGTN